MSLTKEQKEDLKRWERSFRIWLLALVFWVLLFIWPLTLLEKILGRTGEYVNGAVILFLIIMNMRHLYSKRCPICNTRLFPWFYIGVMSVYRLPERCRKCGVSFHS